MAELTVVKSTTPLWDQEIQDGALVNATQKLGVSGDPRMDFSLSAGIRFEKRLQVDLLMDLEWGCQRHVHELPKEATRKWIELVVEPASENTDPGELSKVITDRLEELKTKEVLRQVLGFERAYGGAAVIIVADGSDNMEPLDAEGDAQLYQLAAVSRWSLDEPTMAEVVMDPASPDFGRPQFWRLNSVDRNKMVSPFREDRIHHSRVIPFWGVQHREEERANEWGRSVLEGFFPVWRDFVHVSGHSLSIAARIAETRIQTPGWQELLARDFNSANNYTRDVARMRSNHRLLMLGTEDQITDANLNLSGVADLMAQARANVAGASGFTEQRFFGHGREGMGDRDESGSERDDAFVASYQRDALLQPLNRLIELVIAEQGLRDQIETWQVSFVPLREETPANRAERQKLEAETAALYYGTGAISEDEIRNGRRNDPDNPYPLEEGPAPGVANAPSAPAVPPGSDGSDDLGEDDDEDEPDDET